jgi:hypothetical protein
MRIAWFRDTPPDRTNPLDDTVALIAELARSHVIDIVSEHDAHDFVWRQLRQPWDLCVYELDDTPAHQFVWAYLVNYPGLALLKSPRVHHSWGAALSREGRLQEYMAAFQLDDRAERATPLQIPLYASRLVVVPFAALASELRGLYPHARIRSAPVAVGAIESSPSTERSRRALRVAATSARIAPLERAADRARAAGADIEVISGETAPRLDEADVVVSLAWPPFDTAPAMELAAMAAGKPIVILESGATADWPALDPQTWLPRDAVGSPPPIAITIDPRDEEHSLTEVLRRLANDRELRETLGQAANAWWRAHATPAHAAAEWLPILQEAATLAPPPRPAAWPAHLDADGTELARSILSEFEVTSDLLPTDSQARS